MLKFADLKEGEQISFTQYLTVKSINKSNGSIATVDPSGNPIAITGSKLIEENFYSSAQFAKTIKAGKNKLAEVLQGAGDTIFTVSFNKKNGDERILVGKLIGAEPNLGRTKVVDLKISPDDRTKGIRMVDNRELNWIVLGQEKYIAQ